MKATKIFFYLYMRKLYFILIALLILTITVQIVDFIELTRNNLNREGFSFKDILKMSFLKTPFLINEITPFIIIISTSFFFKTLIDNNELISMRNVGLSILNIFYPVGLAIFTLGILSLLILNPISSIFMNYYNQIDNKASNTSNIIKLDDGNIWIKNKFNNRILYINAKNMNMQEMKMEEIMIIDNAINNSKIYFSSEGELKEKNLSLNNVEEIIIEKNITKTYDKKDISINFTQQDILNSVKYYKYTPFFNYWSYSNSMKKLSYLSTDIVLYFFSELFKPFLLLSIGYVVSGFVAKFKRNYSFFKTIFISVIIGFIIFLIDKLIYSMDTSGIFSYVIIILTIPIISLILGTFLIIRVEKD